jgi:hypothetical protein
MNSLKEHLKKYAERELELTGFKETSFGKDSVTLLENLADLTNGDINVMRQLCEWLPRLVERIPISPITEDDFQLEQHGNESTDVWRCTRYPHVYRTTDGKYWNDRAVVFKHIDSVEGEQMFLYRPGGSKREITLPYFPVTEIQYLPKDDQ